jgi:hypothetical protein
MRMITYRHWTARPSPVWKPQLRNPNTSGKERSSRSQTRYVHISPLHTLSIQRNKPPNIPPPHQVNSDILGGLVVEIGDRTIDLSVSGRISKMNKLLTDTL